MARKKKSSAVYEKALKRAAGLASIDPALDLGNGITLAAFQTAITNTKNAVDVYNTALSNIDGLYNTVKTSESALKTLNERTLISVAAKFGKDSAEYEKAGGVRKSERKKPAKRKLTDPKS